MYVHNGISSRKVLSEHRSALDLLNSVQFAHAENYLINALPRVVKGIPLREAADLGDWFTQLTADQQTQVVEFYHKELLDSNGLKLTWYEGHGQEQGQYRYELAIAPVTSR